MGAQTKVDNLVGENVLNGHSIRHPGIPGVYQQSLAGIDAESFKVIFFDVIGKTVALGGIDGIKFVNLHKPDAVHTGA